jgi:rhamnopyranosyl-N-acetylglucosaminyl-diphospho-decaprenol beta-1,3/1,4-galactofuranosyltransferase
MSAAPPASSSASSDVRARAGPARPAITAVVVTHNRPRLLRAVLDALHRQARPPNRVMVVDNASDAPTTAMLALLRASGDCGAFDVLRSERNLGGAGGFAMGLQAACNGGADWAWLLDDDAIPRADALGALESAAARAGPGCGAVCCAVREFGRLARGHRRSYGRFAGLERALPRTAYAGAPVRIGTGSFVGFMVAATAVARIGLPEPAFFLSYDDTDYSLRLRRAGFALWLAPASVIDHLRSPGGRLRTGPVGARHYFNIRNRIITARRHAACPRLAAALGALTGVALWLACSGRFHPGACAIVRQALLDGWRGRLGPYPPEHASHHP